MQRRSLLAYLIGAAVAGTLLFFPYAGRALIDRYAPLIPLDAPFFLLPIAWGGWNLLRARLRPAVSPGAWGALLGLLLALGINLMFVLRGQWSGPLLLLGLWVPAVYAILWTFIVVPLNRALDVE